MYDDLVEALRRMANTWLAEEYKVCAEAVRFLTREAADAIEELTREAEEYKAAYRKEHNKRIAENRYLYDELTKAVKEKLLMTPNVTSGDESLPLAPNRNETNRTEKKRNETNAD